MCGEGTNQELFPLRDMGDFLNELSFDGCSSSSSSIDNPPQSLQTCPSAVIEHSPRVSPDVRRLNHHNGNNNSNNYHAPNEKTTIAGCRWTQRLARDGRSRSVAAFLWCCSGWIILFSVLGLRLLTTCPPSHSGLTDRSPQKGNACIIKILAY